jgi:hypothetical protein
LRFGFRNFPLREIHPYAEAAAETAEFATTHGKFWEMHDLIFENQNSLSEQMLGELAQRLTPDRQALTEALASGTFAERVRRDFLRRRAQRGERNSDVFYQWPAPRWRLRAGDASSSDQQSGRQIDFSHSEKKPHSFGTVIGMHSPEETLFKIL